MRIIYQLEFDLDTWIEEMRRCRDALLVLHPNSRIEVPANDGRTMPKATA